ncbi:dihydrolipoamide acetyltransferase family protein [Candidatus Spongiisocius sp.]|uniref:dihydrolipoamide acetyltransferase family protein n=1 Tax=Candidatus Spongiisocius sp. TaxID=3101273 RepID=UPI003B5945B6
MPYVFDLPDIGDGLTEADIVRWHVPVGGPVEADQVLVDVETAKAVVEIPAPAGGTVLHHGAREGETLAVGAVLAVIGRAGEVWPDGDQPGEVATASQRSSSPVGDDRAGGQPSGDAPVKALPVVRRLAREHGIDLSSVRGTGPGGRITRDDVMAAVDGGPPDGDVAPIAGERVRLSMLRRTIAGHMTASWREIPHVTVFHDADATRLLAGRRALAARHGRSIPMEALVIRALVPVLEEFRVFNATLDGDELVFHPSLDVGIAVDTDEGLLVPVIRQSEKLGLMELAATIADLGVRGKARSLGPDDLTGATFTVSNIGALGGARGTPIVPLGTTAILAIGRATDTPVVRDGAVTVAPMMPLSLGFDHRAIDGGLGQRFLNRLVENLEEPALFMAG